MRNTYNINFYCRPCKANKNGLAPIELSIIINGKRTFIQLPRKEYPATFKKQSQSKRSNPIREYMDLIRNQFNSIQLDMLKYNIPLTAEALKEYFRAGGVKSYTIKDLFDEYMNLLEKRVDVNLSYKAFCKYKDAARCFFNMMILDIQQVK